MSEGSPELQVGDRVRHRTAAIEGRVKAVTAKSWVYVQVLDHGEVTVTVYSKAREWERCEAKL